jgi:hypothetical protein
LLDKSCIFASSSKKIYRYRAAPAMVFKNIYRYRTATATAVAARQRWRQRSHRHGHLWLETADVILKYIFICLLSFNSYPFNIECIPEQFISVLKLGHQ